MIKKKIVKMVLIAVQNDVTISLNSNTIQGLNNFKFNNFR